MIKLGSVQIFRTFSTLNLEQLQNLNRYRAENFSRLDCGRHEI